ncbi:unnamed protein product, partial [Didymodactylos carnosus]
GQQPKDQVIIKEQPKISVNEVKVEPLSSTEKLEPQHLRGGGGIGHAILNGFTIFEINSHYSWIPRFAVEIFLKGCVACQLRKPIKQHVASKPIISLGVMTRLQIDLVDMRTRPDTVSADVLYRWILNCVDHFSKYSWAFPLKNKSAVDVSLKLRELFFLFGPPRVLHSGNGKEFVASVITELKNLFPNLCFVQGRPRHPQSQGCSEDFFDMKNFL